MKLRFDVDQAACLRKGIDCPKSIVTVEINPADLTQEQRDMIADRMDGIDIMALRWENLKYGVISGPYGYTKTGRTKASKRERTDLRLEAKAPTFDALWQAIQENEAKLAGEPIKELETPTTLK